MKTPRELLPEVDYSGLHAEPGSRQWIVTQRSLMLTCLTDIKNNLNTARVVFAEIRQHGGWQHLRDAKNHAFRDFDDFCRSRNGLGIERAEIERRLTAQQLARDNGIGPARDAKGGRPRKGENLDDIQVFSGTSAARLVAKLKRDAPEIAKRLAAGEFRYATDAARAAGFKVDTPYSVRAHRAWKHMTTEERREFYATHPIED